MRFLQRRESWWSPEARGRSGSREVPVRSRGGSRCSAGSGFVAAEATRGGFAVVSLCRRSSFSRKGVSRAPFWFRSSQWDQWWPAFRAPVTVARVPVVVAAVVSVAAFVNR